MARLLELFGELRPPPIASDAFAVKALAVGSRVWMGKDEQSRPVVLIEAQRDADRLTGIVLRNLSFQPWASCRITEAGGNSRDIDASVIRCTAPERELHEHFMRAFSPSCEGLGSQPTVSEVALLVERLAEVFQALAEPSSDSVQGLWAELLLISKASDIDLATGSWQPRRRSLVDFESGRTGIEVKSCLGDIRQHRFRLAQLRPPEGSVWLIFSVMLTSRPTGASIPDLWNTIEERLRNRPGLRDRVAVRIAQTLGDDWRRVHSRRFDVESAMKSIAVLSADQIPRVGEEAGPAITDIEFTVDLSGVPLANREGLSQYDALLYSLWPQDAAAPP
jgi:Putative  PD-(D/E)XK family member, (DUF4420)